MIKDYIWQQGLHPVAQIDASMPAQAGMPSEGIIYLHTDHLLTNRLATDATREVIWRWEGEAFGNTPASGSVSVNLRFPGQYYDAETNLHYNHFRYYDPELGRYITSDPIGLRGGMNTYGYVNQNPMTNWDFIGLSWTCFYDIRAGRIVCYDDETGEETYEDKICYSGKGEDKNKPESTDKKDKGPIPKGGWDVGDKFNSMETGPDTVILKPHKDNSVHKSNRDPFSFRMHGDKKSDLGNGSTGCIVCGNKTRNAIYKNDGGGAIIYAY